MGDYLDMAGSTKASPNENYARELMQLFSIGEDMLNLDGSLKLDVQGAPIPAYTGSDVHEVARALTGWTCVRFPGASPKDKSRIDYTQRMIRSASDYDADAKSFLGVTVPAQASQSASVDAVVDAVFNHPNVAPYVSKSLIQQLVVSNPTPAYVERVARVFADNGQGVRGSMRSVVRAILLDPEARGDRLAAIEGKVKEPVLLAVALARAIGMTTDGYVFTTRDGVMGQPLWSAPSVFNFYPPDYPLPLGAPLVSPPSKLLTTAADVGRHNLVYDWTVEGDADRKEFKPHTQSATGTKPLWADWEAAAADVEGLMDRVNLLLLGNGMSATQRSAMRGALTAIVNKNATTQARQRAQTALYLAASSPLFQVDR